MSRDQLEADLHRATGAVAAVAGAGDRIATCQANGLRSLATSWAMMLAGVVEVAVPAAASAQEAHHVLSDARPTALLLEADAPAVGSAAEELGITVLVDAGGRATAPTADHPRTRPMSYTSGTTGRRKGVFAGVHDEDWGRQWLTDERTAFADRHGDRHLVVSPLYHSGPLRHAIVCADAGGQVRVLPHFDLEDWLAALREFRPTSMFCVPTHLRRLLAHPGLRRADLSSLSLLVHAGAPCPEGLKRDLHELAPPGAVWEFYGSTEGQFTACPPNVWDSAPGTVGPARPDRQVTVRDRHGEVVAAGVRGTVWATAPAHARWEYWDLPEETSRAWQDGAFTVGDVGHLDEQGRLFLHGRMGDLVITGGVNVYPAEVEQVLRTIDGVADVAVFGMPDDDWGERVVAAVVAEPGAHLTRDQVVAAARDRLSPAGVPKQVVVVPELPHTPTGKVQRTALPALLDES